MTDVICNENWDKINDIIQSNKPHLLRGTEGCTNSFRENGDSSFIKYFANNNSISDTLELKTMLAALKRRGYCRSRHNLYLLDENIYKMFIDLLGVIKQEQLSYRLFQIVNSGNRVLFEKNKSNIKSVILPYLNKWQLATEILIKCELSEIEKEKVNKELKTYFKNNLPYHIRVLLGEKNIEDSIIHLYDRETNFGRLKELIKELELAGTEKCKMALLKSLNTKKEELHSTRYSYSIKFFIIQALGKFHPEEHLLNDDFQDIIYDIEEYPTHKEKNKQLTVEYYLKLYDWISQNYGLKLEELRKADFLYSYALSRFYDENDRR